MPKLLPVCPFVETLPWDEEELLLFRSELEGRGDPDSPVAELPASSAKADAESASTRAEAAMAAEILAIRMSLLMVVR